MFTVLNLLIIATVTVLAIVIFMLSKQRKQKFLVFTDMSDDEFVRIFHQNFSFSPKEIVVRERQFVANLLGIPVTKLSPLQTFTQFSEVMEPLEYSLVLGDLEEEISELFADASITKPYPTPSNIGGLIEAIIPAKQILETKGRHFK